MPHDNSFNPGRLFRRHSGAGQSVRASTVRLPVVSGFRMNGRGRSRFVSGELISVPINTESSSGVKMIRDVREICGNSDGQYNSQAGSYVSDLIWANLKES